MVSAWRPDGTLLQITSKQLRDDLMTMLIAGHETTAAVLTWTLHCLADRPDVLKRLQQEVGTLVSSLPLHLSGPAPNVGPYRALRPAVRELSRGSSLGAGHGHLLLSSCVQMR